MNTHRYPPLKIGILALADAAPIIVAHEFGYFEEFGLNVTLELQASWATARDRLATGALDASHMLGTVPVASFGGPPPLRGHQRLISPLALSLNGNTLALSQALFARLCDVDERAATDPFAAARALGKVVADRAARGQRPPSFASVFAQSSHAIDLRTWLAAGGINADRDVHLTIAPPSDVEPLMEHGEIDGYCVGEPWGSLAVARGAGRVVISGYDLWSNRIEKVLAIRDGFELEHPGLVESLLGALIRAGTWLDAPGNRPKAADLLVEGGYLEAPIDVVRNALSGLIAFGRSRQARLNPDSLVFHRYAAQFPWRSQAAWFAVQMQKFSLGVQDVTAATSAFRPDLYRAAALALGEVVPLTDSKMEGGYAAPWMLQTTGSPLVMGASQFFHRGQFDPNTLETYGQNPPIA